MGLVDRIGENKLMAFGLAIYLIFGFVAIFAGHLAPYQPNKVNAEGSHLSPSGEYILGTDHLGRDVFSRAVYSTRNVLLNGIGLLAVIVTIGVPLGLAAGYCKHESGRGAGASARILKGIYGIVKWFTNALILIPWLILIIALVGLEGTSLTPSISSEATISLTFLLSVVAGVCVPLGLILRYLSDLNGSTALSMIVAPFLALGALEFIQTSNPVSLILLTAPAWSGFAKLIRNGFTLSERGVKTQENASILRPALPALRAVLILGLAAAVLLNFMLNFLGFGTQPPTPTWGYMLREAQASSVLGGYWWTFFFPGLAITLLVIGLCSMGEVLRKELNKEQTFYLPGPNAR